MLDDMLEFGEARQKEIQILPNLLVWTRVYVFLEFGGKQFIAKIEKNIMGTNSDHKNKWLEMFSDQNKSRKDKILEKGSKLEKNGIPRTPSGILSQVST